MAIHCPSERHLWQLQENISSVTSLQEFSDFHILMIFSNEIDLILATHVHLYGCSCLLGYF